MAEFSIQSSDGTYTYNSLTAAGGSRTAQIKFDIQNNNVFADTQGFLRKKQVGRNRIKARVILTVTQTNYENTFIPMEVYQDYFEVTFDRYIPRTGSATGNFQIEDINILQEFDEGNEIEIEIVLTEILEPI